MLGGEAFVGRPGGPVSEATGCTDPERGSGVRAADMSLRSWVVAGYSHCAGWGRPGRRDSGRWRRIVTPRISLSRTNREEEVAAEETGTRRTGRAARAPRARGAFRGRFGERGLADCSAPRGAGGAGAPGAQLRTLPAAVRGAANRSN